MSSPLSLLSVCVATKSTLPKFPSSSTSLPSAASDVCYCSCSCRRPVDSGVAARNKSLQQGGRSPRRISANHSACANKSFTSGTIDKMLLAHVDADGDAIPTIYHVRYDGADLKGDEASQHGKEMVRLLPPTSRQSQLDRIKSCTGYQIINGQSGCIGIGDVTSTFINRRYHQSWYPSHRCDA